MKFSTKMILLIETLCIITLFTLYFVFDVVKNLEYVSFFVIIVTYIISIFILGSGKSKYSDQKSAIIIVIIFSLLYQVLTFIGFGYLLGFAYNPLRFGLEFIGKIILPSVLLIVISEIFRNYLIIKGKTSKLAIASIIIFFILLDVFIEVGSFDLLTFKGIFQLCSFVIFPSIIKNLFLVFISYNYGKIPCIIYSIIMNIIIMFSPIIPNYNEYLIVIVNIFFNFLLLSFFYNYISKIKIKNDKTIEKLNKKVYPLSRFFQIVLIIMLFMFILLISGVLKYYLLVVGSDSMEPNIFIGDMIIVEKRNDYENLKIGQVLVYRHENMVILHRIIDIEENINGRVFYTKGDNNKSNDGWQIKEEDVIGITNYRIPYIGYPTIWLNRLF